MEKLDPVVVLRVEKVVKKLEVFPIVVESVLKAVREILDNSPRDVLTLLTACWVIEKLLQVMVEKEENPDLRSVPTELIPTRRVLESWPTNVL